VLLAVVAHDDRPHARRFLGPALDALVNHQ
jgi:hypothetical protein